MKHQKIDWSFKEAVEFITENINAYIPCRKCEQLVRIGDLHPYALCQGSDGNILGICTICAAPGKRKEQRRRAREQNAIGSFTAEEWNALCDRYDYRCLCCREQKALTADHVIPLHLGGSNRISNIQPLCLSCNSKKGLRMVDYRPMWRIR